MMMMVIRRPIYVTGERHQNDGGYLLAIFHPNERKFFMTHAIFAILSAQLGGKSLNISGNNVN